MVKDNSVVLNFTTKGQVQYAKTIKDINAIMNAAAKEYRAHIKSMADDASQTEKLTAEKKKLETQLEAGRERTEKLRAEFEAMQSNTKATTAQLSNMYGKLKDSESAEATLERRLKEVNEGLSEQAQKSRENESALSNLKNESNLLGSEAEKLNSEFELLESQLGDNATETEKAALAQEKFARQSELAEKQISNLEKQLELVKQEFGENSVEANKMETELNQAKTSVNNLNREMREVGNASGEAQTGLGKLTDIVKSQAMLELANQLGQVSDKLFEIGKSAIETAAEYQASEAQFEQVFGSVQEKATDTTNSLSKEFDMLPNRIKPGLTKMTSMFKGLGLDTEEALGLAEDAVRSSADAAAFYDTSFEEANGSLTSFLKGNYQAGEAIGIFANDTQMATYAIKEGVVQSSAEWQKLDEATKQATRLEYAQNMQAMAGATGQASRESEGYENQMGNAKAAVDEFMNAIGEEALEMFLDTLQLIIPAIVSVATWFKELNPIVKQLVIIVGAVIAAIGALLPLFAIIGMVVTTGMAPALAIFALVVVAITAIIMIVKNWGKIMDWIKDKVTAVAGWIRDKFESIAEKVGDVKDKIVNAFTNAIDKAKEIVSKGIQKIKSFFDFEWSLPKLKMPKFSVKGKFSLNPPSMPKFDVDWRAKGGIFTKPTIFGESNGKLQGAGEAGTEAVLPLNDETLAAIGRGIPSNGTIHQHIHFGKVDANNPSELERVNRNMEKAGRQAVYALGGEFA